MRQEGLQKLHCTGFVTEKKFLLPPPQPYLNLLLSIKFVYISPEEEAIASKATFIDVREFCLLVFVQITKKRYIDRELPSPAYIQSLKNKQTGQIQIL